MMCSRHSEPGAGEPTPYRVLIEGDDKDRRTVRLVAYGPNDIRNQVDDRWPGYTVLRQEEGE